MQMTIKVKICGIKTEEALEAALASGADFVGLNFYDPSPRSLTPQAARHLAGRARERARSVAVLVDPDDALLDRIISEVQPDLIQLHGRETPARVAAIVARHGRPVIKALAVQSGQEAEAAQSYAAMAQHILFDAKAPQSMPNALPGGNGLSFDWHMLEGMRAKLDFMLSGGLTPDNVATAIRLTRPYGVDVSSGVETAPGDKSPELIKRFIAAAKAAQAAS